MSDTSEQRTYTRLVRRETHRSRSTAVIVALVVTALVAAYLGTEAVLAAIGRPPLLLTPAELFDALDATASWSAIAIAALAVLGVIAIIAAVTRGRRSRHRLADDRMAVVVDDDVLAGAVSRRVALSGSVDRRQARTVVARRRATVRLTPNSGFVIDSGAASDAASLAIEQLAPHPAVRTRVIVAEHGVLS
jgi:hypothetical protein